jgi:AraC family transcriptional regulator
VAPLSCARPACQALQAETLAVGIIHAQKPQLDELFVAHGLDAQPLTDWFQTGHKRDPLLAQALRAGVAAAPPRGNAPAILTAMTPHNLAEHRWWWLRATRQGAPFDAEETKQANRLVRAWAARFNLPAEPGVGLVLVGHDDRLIALNLAAAERGARPGEWVNDLLAAVKPVVRQRHPELPVGHNVDLAVEAGSAAYWVWLRRARAINVMQGEHLHVELRPLPKDELPIVGVVQDERVAHAIAFLHESYHRSPTLAEAAKHAHMSPFHFHRLFKKQVGVSPKQYLQQKQLQVAKWLLRSGRTPVGVIAQHAGFSSHGHFTSTFHRLVGVSPSQYREMS